MLADELAGRHYVKSHHNAALRQLIGRTAGSVERKHMNISAVLTELGLPTINGYKPFSNFQEALGRTIERYLLEHPEALRGDAFVPRWGQDAAGSSALGFVDTPALFVDDAPPSPGAPRAPRPEGVSPARPSWWAAASDHRLRTPRPGGDPACSASSAPWRNPFLAKKGIRCRLRSRVSDDGGRRSALCDLRVTGQGAGLGRRGQACS